MTDQSIIIAVAKLDGFTQLDSMPNPMFALEVCEYEAACCHTRASEFEYLTSRDAIIPVIEKRITNPEIEKVFNYALYDLLPKEVTEVNAMTYVMAVKATAKQLCIALLKATGKWMEE